MDTSSLILDVGEVEVTWQRQQRATGTANRRRGAALAGRAWLAALPDELAAQRRVMAGLADRCETWPLATSLLVGCSLGRGAADALSDIDAALGVDAPPGAPAPTGGNRGGDGGGGAAGTWPTRRRAAAPDRARSQHVRRIFAQFADGTQLDLAVVSEAEIETRAAPAVPRTSSRCTGTRPTGHSAAG